MARVKIAPTLRGWTPEPEHRSSVGTNPEENDITLWITIGSAQTNDSAVKALSNSCVCDRNMSFVKIQDDSQSKLPATSQGSVVPDPAQGSCHKTLLRQLHHRRKSRFARPHRNFGAAS